MSVFFDESYYLTSKLAQLRSAGEKDANGNEYTMTSLQKAIADAGLTPETHYQTYGRAEKLNPNAYFNEAEYLTAKTRQVNSVAQDGRTNWTVEEVKAAMEAINLTAAEHYEVFGGHETDADGRLINPSNAFDANAYAAAKLFELAKTEPEKWVDKTAADVVAAIAEAGMSPITHYELHGATEANVFEIPLVQTVPVAQRVENDPARAEVTGELVPSNYNTPTPPPGTVTAETAAPVTKPADVGGKANTEISPEVKVPSEPVPVPDDADYVAPPANIVDTNDKPVVVVPPATSGGKPQYGVVTGDKVNGIDSSGHITNTVIGKVVNDDIIPIVPDADTGNPPNSGSGTGGGESVIPVHRELSIGKDALEGTSADDTFSGILSTTEGKTTFQSEDTINGMGGFDTFTLSLDGEPDKQYDVYCPAIDLGNGITNIEKIRITQTSPEDGDWYTVVGEAEKPCLAVSCAVQEITIADGISFEGYPDIESINDANDAQDAIVFVQDIKTVMFESNSNILGGNATNNKNGGNGLTAKAIQKLILNETSAITGGLGGDSIDAKNVAGNGGNGVFVDTIDEVVFTQMSSISGGTAGANTWDVSGGNYGTSGAGLRIAKGTALSVTGYGDISGGAGSYSSNAGIKGIDGGIGVVFETADAVTLVLNQTDKDSSCCILGGVGTSWLQDNNEDGGNGGDALSLAGTTLIIRGGGTIQGGQGGDGGRGSSNSNGGNGGDAVFSSSESECSVIISDIVSEDASKAQERSLSILGGVGGNGTQNGTMGASGVGFNKAVTVNASGYSGVLCLDGSNEADKITSGSGDDVIRGMGSADTITGGAGADTFVYTSLAKVKDETGITLESAETITDFKLGEDHIKITGTAGDTTNYAEDDSVADFATALSAANTAFNKTVVYYFTSTEADGGLLFVDSDQDGTADAVIKLNGVTAENFSEACIVA